MYTNLFFFALCSTNRMAMFCFERAYLLYALLFVPVMVAGYILLMARDRKRWERFGELVLLDGLMPSRSFRMRHFKLSLYMLAYSCMVLALANPQVGSGVEKGKRQGINCRGHLQSVLH